MLPLKAIFNTIILLCKQENISNMIRIIMASYRQQYAGWNFTTHKIISLNWWAPKKILLKMSIKLLIYTRHHIKARTIPPRCLSKLSELFTALNKWNWFIHALKMFVWKYWWIIGKFWNNMHMLCGKSNISFVGVNET